MCYLTSHVKLHIAEQFAENIRKYIPQYTTECLIYISLQRAYILSTRVFHSYIINKMNTEFLKSQSKQDPYNPYYNYLF